VKTGTTVHNNKPNITIRDTERETCLLIDFAVSGGRNVIQKEAEKISKGKDLTIEIQRMWNVKTEVVAVRTEAAGTISKSFSKYLSNIPRTHDIKELRSGAAG
jgi:hypothetical protein